MASATNDFAQRMAQVLVANPDGRTRQHKQAVKDVYESTIASLIVKLSTETARNKEMRSRVALANTDDEPTPSCSICMEDMRGRVTLVCGHEMCPDCFAQHSRVNNTCPFCREEFAPKPKKQSKMPLYQLEGIAAGWAEYVTMPTAQEGTGYFRRQADTLINKNDGTLAGRLAVETHIQWLITANGKILMQKVKDWYDNDIA
jgi:hypothetical protein